MCGHLKQDSSLQRPIHPYPPLPTHLLRGLGPPPPAPAALWISSRAWWQGLLAWKCFMDYFFLLFMTSISRKARFLCVCMWLFMQVCIYVHMCVGTCEVVHLLVCVHACGGQSLVLGDFFNCSLPYLLRQVLSLNPEFTNLASLASWLAQGPGLSVPPEHWDYRQAHHLAFKWVLGTQTWALVLLQQVLYWLSHVFFPETSCLNKFIAHELSVAFP